MNCWKNVGTKNEYFRENVRERCGGGNFLPLGSVKMAKFYFSSYR